MNFHAIKKKIEEIEKREKKIKNPFKYLKTVLDKPKKSKKYNFKRYITYFLIVFIAINFYIYVSLYKVNVLSASKNFVDSRVCMTNATMFHLYYIFFVKAGIDFKSKLLTPLVAPRNYFYEKGLKILPKDDAESAIWFDTFKVRAYDYSVNGQHGNMAKLYGVEFTKDFTSEIYRNIETLSTKWLHEYSRFKELQTYTIEKYVLLMTIYMNDFHLNTNGGLLNKKNIMRIHTNKNWYETFKKLYELQNNFFTYYKKYYPEDYNRALDETKGYYSIYADHYINKWLLTTFILYYEKNNKLLSEKSMKYINDMKDSKQRVGKLMFNNKTPTKEQESKLFGLNEYQINKIIKKINKGEK